MNEYNVAEVKVCKSNEYYVSFYVEDKNGNLKKVNEKVFYKKMDNLKND